MWVLDQPYIPRADRLSAGTPLMLLTVLAAGAAAAVVAIELGALPARALRIVGVTAGHGALLASALAWAGVSAPSQALTVALLGLASTAAGLAPFGAVAYLLPALCVIRLAARGQLTSLSLGTPVSPRGVFAGILVGAGLSSHLLISASRTLGMQVRVDHVPEVLAAIAYDVGANVLAAECFFRGVPHARLGMSLIALALVAVTALVALEDGGPASLLRHAYLVPVLAGALRFGAVGGGLAAMAAVLLSAPFVLPEIERSGLTAEAVEGLVTFAVLGLVGVLSGVLRTRAGRQGRRYGRQRAVAPRVRDAAGVGRRHPRRPGGRAERGDLGRRTRNVGGDRRTRRHRPRERAARVATTAVRRGAGRARRDGQT